MGILVAEIPGLAWQTVFRGALASQVRVWGGSGNFVLPLCADTKDSEVFWALTELLDPDWWGVYAGSHRELEDLDASWYADWRADIDARVAGCPADERDQFLDEAHAEPLVDASIPEDLHRLLVTRGATLNHDGHMALRGPASATGAPRYPAVDALALGGLPEEVVEVEANATPTLQLLAAADFGPLSPDLREALDARGVRRRARRPSSNRELMRWLYDLRAHPRPGPFALAEFGLGWYRPRPLVEDSITVVAGEEAWDFAFAYALRRARTHAFWVPASVFSSQGERETVHRSLVWLAQQTGAPLVVTSVSDEAAGHALANALGQRTRSAVIRTATWREALPERSNRLLVTNRLGRPEAIYLEDGVTPHLRTPIPDVSDEPDKLRWMTELEVRDWAPTRHHALAPQLLGGGASIEARVTRQGLAYEGLSPMVRFGVALEQLTVQPVLQPLPLLRQLRYVASASLWSCELSQKGQFALAAADLFGGFTELCKALRDEDVGKVLYAYLDAERGGPGLALTDRRRYLSLEDLRALDLTSPGEDVLDSLRERRVLQPGLVLKCARCRHTDWYRPRETDPTFECTRCAAARKPDRGSWLREPEARWHYRLDEVVFQFARHRGDVPALAAFERFDQSRQPIQFVPELALTNASGQECEVDFAVTEGTSLWLGEAFSGRSYAKTKSAEMGRLRRLAEAAAALNARGIILATSADDIAPITKERAETVFPGPWPTLELRRCVFHLPRPTGLLDAG
jgi:hypothetical protein